MLRHGVDVAPVRRGIHGTSNSENNGIYGAKRWGGDKAHAPQMLEEYSNALLSVRDAAINRAGECVVQIRAQVEDVRLVLGNCSLIHIHCL